MNYIELYQYDRSLPQQIGAMNVSCTPDTVQKVLYQNAEEVTLSVVYYVIGHPKSVSQQTCKQ